MDTVLILEPIKVDYIWGVEYWCVSAHPRADCTVKNGVYEGMKLSGLWKEHRDLFGNLKGDVFPLLTKVIDARDDLSIQVHPDDAYAGTHENGALGKNECWYVLDCRPGTEIIIGHNAKDKAEVARMIRAGEWEKFLRKAPLGKGDFFQINAGCVHAIMGGTRILETQQNSDITYRLYDYDRLKDGRKRELHIEQSIDCIRAPFVPDNGKPVVRKTAYGVRTDFVKSSHYSFSCFEINGTMKPEENRPFEIVSILNGTGEIAGTEIAEGMHLIVPESLTGKEWSGHFTAAVSWPE